MKDPKYPQGWDEARVQRALDHYEHQSDDRAPAEDQEATHTAMEVPVELVDEIRELIAKRRAG